MRRLAALFVLGAITTCPAASEPAPAALYCVPATDCGCSIIVATAACPAGHAHFFHELADGAPLRFGDVRGPVSAASMRPGSNTFSPAPGESWTQAYRYGGGEVQIRYTPGADTCPKRTQGEECEYFDVRAQVLVSDPQGTRRYAGIGTCGC